MKPLKQPSARRGAPHANATLVRFNTADGISLDGAMVGTGTVGVVLAHEYDNDLCGACPVANYPAKRGVRVFAIDVRCFGRSVCPQGDAAGRVVDDLVAVVAQLRQRGVTRVALVGASMGRLGGAGRRHASKASGRPGRRAIGPGETDQPASYSAQRPWRRLAEFTAAHTPRPFSESIVACGMMAHRRCGVGPRFEGWRHRCRRKMGLGGVCQVSADQLAVVEAAGKYAAQVGLIGDSAIASFKEIAAGLISRARGTECSRVVWTSSVRGVRGRSVRHAALRLQALGPVRRARRGRLGNPHGSGQPGRPGPSRAARACWDRS
jgi:pimeloyl-ACP methyl ester carboxylesterase